MYPHCLLHPAATRRNNGKPLPITMQTRPGVRTSSAELICSWLENDRVRPDADNRGLGQRTPDVELTGAARLLSRSVQRAKRRGVEHRVRLHRLNVDGDWSL